MTSPKTIDAAMFEEPADNRFDADSFGQSRHARPQTANAANDEINRNPRSRSVIKRVDNPRIDQRIHLHPDRRGPPCLGVRDLLRDVVKDAFAKVDRRYRHAFKLGRLSIAGDVIEYACDITTDDHIRGKE